jgi:hypothetical protein
MLLLKPAASAPVLGAACGQLRCLSAAAQDVVGEMISYARQNFKVCRCSMPPSTLIATASGLKPGLVSQTAPDQALDVLKSGLSYMNVGPDAGRCACSFGYRGRGGKGRLA